MTKELSKTIMEKSKARKKYFKWPSRENYVSYENSNDKSNSFIKKAKKYFLRKLQEMGLCLIKSFEVPGCELENRSYHRFVEIGKFWKLERGFWACSLKMSQILGTLGSLLYITSATKIF